MRSSLFKANVFFLILFTASLVRAEVPKQLSANYFDFDDNIAFTEAKIMVWDRDLQKEVPVSTAHWALVKNKIMKNANPGVGEWKNRELRPDGLRFFGDTGPRGPSEFKLEIEEMVAHKPDGSWKAPRWNSFVNSLKNPETRPYTGVITARLASPDSVLNGLKAFGNKLPALPDKSRLYVVGWPGLEERFQAPTAAESKSKVMLHLIEEVEKTPLPMNAVAVTNRENTGKEPLHLWTFSDDDYDNYSRALNTFSKAAKEKKAWPWPHVKVILFFTGLNNPEQKPRAVVVLSNGETRPATADEQKQSELSQPRAKAASTH